MSDIGIDMRYSFSLLGNFPQAVFYQLRHQYSFFSFVVRSILIWCVNLKMPVYLLLAVMKQVVVWRYELLNDDCVECVFCRRAMSSFLVVCGIVLQIVELDAHPYFVGVQFHPEFKSRPGKPSPLFLGTVLALSSGSRFIHQFLGSAIHHSYCNLM